MSDNKEYFLGKKLRVSAKLDQDAFNIRYHLTQQHDSSPSTKDIQAVKPQEHQQSNQKKFQHKHKKQWISKQDDQHKNKAKPKYHTKKTQHGQNKAGQSPQEKEQINEVQAKYQKKVQSDMPEKLPQKVTPKLSQAVTKTEKQAISEKPLIPLKAKISEIEDEQEVQTQAISKQDMYPVKQQKQSKKVVRQQTFYNNYKSVLQIEESRDSNQGIYFKGQVQFSSELKWNARIYSNEKDGYLLAAGKPSLNRALHDDEVYFRIVEEKKEQISCEIVAVISRRNRQLVGKIEPIQNAIQNAEGYFLRPINPKIAKMRIANINLEPAWLKLIDTHYFLCEFVSWEMGQSFPLCNVLEVYGLAGEIDIETDALLKTYGIKDTPCTQNQLTTIIYQPFAQFFKQKQFTIPEEQLKKRRDFRKWNAFVVRDSIYDVAFSIFPHITRSKGDPNFFKKNIYDINVHVLDLAFFVNKSPALDELLLKRMTRFNLFHKFIPMIPQPLAKATSFQLNKERLTLSICIQVNEDGTILDSIKVTTSIITPKCILSKNELQKWISSEKLPLQQLKVLNSVFKLESQFAGFAKDLRSLAKLMGKARSIRIESGSFNFEQPNKDFSFDQNGKPNRFQLKAKTEADLILEQCIIICLTKLGEFMLKGLKEKAILYRHRYPGSKMLDRLKLLVAKAGYPIEQNAKTQIHQLVNSILSDDKVKQCVKEAIKYEISRLIEYSDYFQSEAQDPTTWNNFAFNIPIFTHCAVPTKKYGDILVQKQLVALIERTQFKVQNLKRLLQRINKGGLLSRKIRADSEKIVLCHYLRQHPTYTTGILLQVFDWGLKVCVTKFGFKTIIKFYDTPSLKLIKSGADQNKRNYVKLEFKGSSQVETYFVLKELQEIDVQIRCSKTIPYEYKVTLVMPNPNDLKTKLLIE